MQQDLIDLISFCGWGENRPQWRPVIWPVTISCLARRTTSLKQMWEGELILHVLERDFSFLLDGKAPKNSPLQLGLQKTLCNCLYTTPKWIFQSKNVWEIIGANLILMSKFQVCFEDYELLQMQFCRRSRFSSILLYCGARHLVLTCSIWKTQTFFFFFFLIVYYLKHSLALGKCTALLVLVVLSWGWVC